MNPHTAAERGSVQTLTRPAMLLVVCTASLAADDLESKFREAVVHHDHVAAVALVRKGLARADATFEDSGSPLCLAARDESADGFDVALELVAHGAPVDRMCAKGLRPLHWAAEAGNLAVFDLLVRNGADISPQTHPEHHTPLYLALSYGNGRVVEYLERKGATSAPVVRQ